MKVICAGLSKTGTKSLARALRILGYKIYDFPEHMDLHLDEWIDIFCGDGKLADFASMYADVDGVTDLPAAFWFEEILACFPEAKVILNVRDNDDVWVQSWAKHLHMTRDLGLLTKLAYLFCPKPRKLLDYYNAEDTAVYGSVNPDSQFLFKRTQRESESGCTGLKITRFQRQTRVGSLMQLSWSRSSFGGLSSRKHGWVGWIRIYCRVR